MRIWVKFWFFFYIFTWNELCQWSLEKRIINCVNVEMHWQIDIDENLLYVYETKKKQTKWAHLKIILIDCAKQNLFHLQKFKSVFTLRIVLFENNFEFFKRNHAKMSWNFHIFWSYSKTNSEINEKYAIFNNSKEWRLNLAVNENKES